MPVRSGPGSLDPPDTQQAALVLNGAPAGDGEVDRLAAVLVDLLEARGLPAGHLTLRDLPIAPCLGCFECWVRTPGLCRTHDGGPAVAEAWIHSELVVLLTPVTFGGYASPLKKALDRLLSTMSPFLEGGGSDTRHRARYDRYPSILGVGVLEEDDSAEGRIFHRLVGRSATHWHAPHHASRLLPRGLSPDEARLWLQPVVVSLHRRLEASRPGTGASVGGPHGPAAPDGDRPRWSSPGGPA